MKRLRLLHGHVTCKSYKTVCDPNVVLLAVNEAAVTRGRRCRLV